MLPETDRQAVGQSAAADRRYASESLEYGVTPLAFSHGQAQLPPELKRGR